MSRRLPPKTFILLFRTHKLTAYTTVAQPEKTTIANLKEEALSALRAPVISDMVLPLSKASPPSKTSEDEDMDDPDNIDLNVEEAVSEDDESWTIPQVNSVEDFELAKAVKDKVRTGQYEVLSPEQTVKTAVADRESIFIQFKGPSGNLLPVKVSLPKIDDDEEEPASVPPVNKGKRKAGPEELDSDI